MLIVTEKLQKEKEEYFMVSIVLCTYNRAHTLKATIDSILNQTCQDFELLIVDDGSTDTTQELLAQYRDERIRVFQMPENSFYCMAANFGLAQAKGSYLAFATSDDTWLPDKLELQIAYMEARPECGACFTYADMIDENGEDATEAFHGLAALFSETHHSQREWLQRFFYEGNCLSHPSAVVRKAVIEEVGGYNLLFCQSADMELWMRIVRRYPIHVLEKFLVHYRCYRNPMQQISGVDELKTARFVNEHMMIRRNLIEDLSDEEMIWYFGDRFRNPDAASHQEIEIEKAFLLMHCSSQLPDFKLLGVEKFEKLLRDPEILHILKIKYQVSVHDIYKWNLGHYYVDYGVTDHLREQERQLASKEEELRIAREALEREKESALALQTGYLELEARLADAGKKALELEHLLEQTQSKYLEAERMNTETGRALSELTDSYKKTQELLHEAVLEKLRKEEAQKGFRLFRKH